MWNLTVTSILDFAIQKWASDIHITEWWFIVLRINWKLTTVESTWKLERVKVNQILLELLNEKKDLIKEFVTKKDLNFSYIWQDGITFRINSFYSLWKVSIVLRKIESKSKTFDELNLPEWAIEVTDFKNWLVIVSWWGWSWKSSTITSIIDNINSKRSEHIVTLEDPVEYIYKPIKSIFSQRNIGRDTLWIKEWLKSSLREDVNIIMIWEIKDKETLDFAMDMAESWTLVLSTVNSMWTWDMIDKLVWFYNNSEKENIYWKLARSLVCSIHQKLVTKADWSWRVAVFEVLRQTHNIKLLIKTGKIFELENAIHVWKKEWMMSLLSYSELLVEKWLMTTEFKEANFTIE